MARYRVEAEAIYDIEVEASDERDAREKVRLMFSSGVPIPPAPRYIEVVAAEVLEFRP